MLVEEARSPLLTLAIKEKRLYLLGKPGAGKTTFLRYLTLQACAGKIRETPIFVELKDWASSELELMDYMARQFEICAFPDAQLYIKHLLEKGHALVLFDGLDEVNQESEKRSNIIRKLKDFTNQYPDVHILLTCRIAASDYTFEQFTYLEIADFTERQVREFASKWYTDERAIGERFLEEIGKPENRGLKELTTTPILLALLCLAFEQTLEFPTSRAELYREALDALLKKWDASRNIRRDRIYKKLTPGRREKLLARIAFQNFEKNRFVMSEILLAEQITSFMKQLPREETYEEIEGDVVLKAIEAQHSILVERAHSIYSFSHLTFQEYLTARYIIENGGSTLVRQIQNHIFDDMWREIFIMIASMMPDTEEFFEISLQAISQIINAAPLYLEMLNQAYQITQPRKNSHGLYDSESNLAVFIYFLVVARDTTLTRDPEPIIARARFQDFDATLTRALKLVHSIALEQAYEISYSTNTIDSYQARYLVRDHARVLDIVKGFQIASEHTHDFDFDLLGTLRNILKYYNIDIAIDQTEWLLDLKQLLMLDNYIKANQTIFDCIKVAIVPDRKAIQSQMFTPLDL